MPKPEPQTTPAHTPSIDDLIAAVKHEIKIQSEDAQRLIDAGFATYVSVLTLTTLGELEYARI